MQDPINCTDGRKGAAYGTLNWEILGRSTSNLVQLHFTVTITNVPTKIKVVPKFPDTQQTALGT